MTGPAVELLERATPYALHAVSAPERATIDRVLAAVPSAVADGFYQQVRAVRETMAAVSAITAAEPPARLRAAVLVAARSDVSGHARWRTAELAAATVVVAGLAAHVYRRARRRFTAARAGRFLPQLPPIRSGAGSE
jgi:hypothetical protein